MTRKPDYVFIVWGDGLVANVTGHTMPTEFFARANRSLRQKTAAEFPFKRHFVTHRIRVYLKKDSKK